MDNSNTLIMTVGLPQSGKSAWAKTQGMPIVNPDSIRLALHGKPFINSAEPFVWAIAKIMTHSLFLAGHETVILDATNITIKRRNEWRSKNWKRIFHTVEASVNTCIERAAQTCIDDEHYKGLIAAIERMDTSFEPVQRDEECDQQRNKS